MTKGFQENKNRNKKVDAFKILQNNYKISG